MALLSYKEKMARLRSRESGSPKKTCVQVKRPTENERFTYRLRFDQSKFWNWNRPVEPQSLIRSSWPPFEAALRIWGIPGVIRYEKQQQRSWRDFTDVHIDEDSGGFGSRASIRERNSDVRPVIQVSY